MRRFLSVAADLLPDAIGVALFGFYVLVAGAGLVIGVLAVVGAI